jgi:hypothetical protein
MISQASPKRILIVLGVVLTLLIGAGVAMSKHRAERLAQYHSAIATVFANRSQLRNEYLAAGHGHRPVRFSPKRYAEALRQIDTTSCPTRFREAWLIYEQAWDRTTNQNIGDLAYEVGSVLQAAGPAHDAHYFLDNAQRLNTREAWFYCERVALEFGVTD